MAKKQWEDGSPVTDPPTPEEVVVDCKTKCLTECTTNKLKLALEAAKNKVVCECSVEELEAELAKRGC